ncbi:MAG TPA: SAF domain-containing protein [Pseudonocardiaceae bacterium]|jgi:pilus assembly protein CpaB|nr:SAF domain-containing protein [Pseudonocardiaceae bacterium]
MDDLAPRKRDRLRALLRSRPTLTTRLRRVLAGVLALLAAGLALQPEPPGVRVVAAARDLAPGVALTEADVHLVDLRGSSPPPGTLDSPSAAVGKVLTGAARAGEPLNDVRLARVDPDRVSVAVRLAEAAVADLLRPGDRVDVISTERTLAENAVVVTVREAKADRLVVLALDRRNATQVAAASLDQPVTVTLR